MEAGADQSEAPYERGFAMQDQTETTTGTEAQVLATALKRNGVKVLFGQSLPSALPRRRTGTVNYRTENAGGVMADGDARISHRIDVLTSPDAHPPITAFQAAP
jgi:acetolactate synthase I/II/III large subunit